jgi:membrane-associated protein
MTELVSEWLGNLPPEALIVVPLLAFLESCLFVGLFVSGIFLLSAVSLIYASGDISLFFLVALAFLGALLGDHFGYFVGYHAAPALWQKKWVRQKIVKRKVAFRRIQTLLVKSAPWAICIGRISPPIRSISPVMAGACRITPFRFFAFDLLACTIWATGLTLLVSGINLI